MGAAILFQKFYVVSNGKPTLPPAIRRKHWPVWWMHERNKLSWDTTKHTENNKDSDQSAHPCLVTHLVTVDNSDRPVRMYRLSLCVQWLCRSCWDPAQIIDIVYTERNEGSSYRFNISIKTYCIAIRDKTSLEKGLAQEFRNTCLRRRCIHKWATTWQKQQNEYAPSED